MRTLDSWENQFTSIPNKIECPEMQLIGGDFEPPIFLGSGYININSSTDIDFTMFATPRDQRDGLKRLERAKENPYESFDQFRLIATDYQGNKWTCGWTLPELKGLTKVGWPITGKLQSLMTAPSSPWVSTESGVELVFTPKISLMMNESMVTITTIGDLEVERRYEGGKKTIEVLGSQIHFFYKPSGDSLWVTANTSDELTHPYLENWLSEPFRILLGQLIYPRLVARNFGNGRAMVSIRPSPKRIIPSVITALLGQDIVYAPQNFWDLYTKLLTLIAKAKDEKGNPNFESHRITRYYEEIIQASQGSLWVLCMTLASAAEGLTNMLMRPKERRSDFAENDIKSLKNTVASWKGDSVLRSRILFDIKRASERSIGKYLRDLVDRGEVKQNSARAWSSVRHQVMHGNLVSTVSTEEEEQRIYDLADLVHTLTLAIIDKEVKIREKHDTESNETAPPSSSGAPIEQ